MYGKTVDFHGVKIFVLGVPDYTEEQWQERAKMRLQYLAKEAEE